MSYRRLGEYLESGLLADRTLKILKKSHKLNDNDRQVIERSLKFINSIIQGRNQVNSGRLQQNAIISVDAYTTTMLAFSQSDSRISPNIEEYLNSVKDEINGVLTTNRVIPDNLKNSIQFFKIIKSYSTNQVSNTLYNKKEETEWSIQIM
jgi:hypothetical protein